MKIAPLHRRFLLLCLCFAAGAAGIRADAETPVAITNLPAHTGYTFPFTALTYGAPIAQAKINGTVTATFLIDTGTSANFISQTVVDRLGLKPEATSEVIVPYILGGKDGKPATFVSPQIVLLGSLALRQGEYLVVPAKTLATMTGGAVDGIISTQMLHYFAIDLDFSRHQMTLWYPGGLADDAVKEVGLGDASTVSLVPSVPDSVLNDPVKAVASAEAYWNLKYSVPVQISDGVHTNQQNLVLDTGSGVTVFPSEVSRNLNLKVQETSTLPNMTTGLQRANVVPAPSLQIGGLRILDHTVGVFQVGTADETPILGVDVLSGYHVLIDFGAKKMYFKTAIPQIRIGAPQDKKP